MIAETEKISAAHLDDFLLAARALFGSGEQQQAIELTRRLVAAEETAEGRAVLARMLFESGDDAGFEAATERALELDPEHRGARLQRVRHLIATQRAALAEPEVLRLLAAYPADFESHLAYGRLLAANARGEAALASIERSLRLAPRFCEAHFERLELLIDLRRADDADRALEELEDRCEDPEVRARAAALAAETTALRPS